MSARGTTALRAVLLAALALGPAVAAQALSAVFAGDPVDSQSGLPYELLPGQPHVSAGVDGRIGTADDVIDRALTGDIDLVVRLGDIPADGIPAPASHRGASLPSGVAGAPGVGTPIPFHVFLSDGATSPEQPYGNRLAAADMNGLPVVVLLFADLNGDGDIGPTGAALPRAAGALHELEPVGREVALFSNGVASGTVAVTAGAPRDRGGLRVVATAIALTGSYDANFFAGFVPNGPAISTALPFLAERDLSKVFSPDIGALAIGGTLNPDPHAAGLPDPAVLDLTVPTDGSSPTVDTARVMAGRPVCARLFDYTPSLVPMPPEPEQLILGSSGLPSVRRMRLLAVDRLGNPSTSEEPLRVDLIAEGPLSVVPDRDGMPAVEHIVLNRVRPRPVALRATGVGSGAVQVVLDGVVCQRLPVAARAELTRGGSDGRVAQFGAADYRTIGTAVAAASDRNGDGRITIAIAEGLYRESVRVTRPVELFGAGRGRTIIDAGGRGPALALVHPAANASDLTASGGTVGISIEAALDLQGLEARANAGAGVRVAAGGAALTGCEARDNGGPGIALDASALVDSCVSEHNGGAGIAVSGAADTVVRGTVSVANGGDGIVAIGCTDPELTGNRAAGNLGAGATLEACSGGMVLDNRFGANDGNGLRLDESDGALIDGNDCSANGGFGMRIGRSDADFDAAGGVQAPPGNNDVSGNRRGPLRLD